LRKEINPAFQNDLCDLALCAAISMMPDDPDQPQTKVHVAPLQAVYPQFEAQLRYLLPRIVENDRQIEFISARAMPTAMERLLGAELIARGLEG
jgi:hypothetical protein